MSELDQIELEYKNEELINEGDLRHLLDVYQTVDPKNCPELIVKLCKSHLRIYEAIYPGRPKFVPTPEVPRQSFYEAMIEGLRDTLNSSEEEHVAWCRYTRNTIVT